MLVVLRVVLEFVFGFLGFYMSDFNIAHGFICGVGTVCFIEGSIFAGRKAIGAVDALFDVL